MNEGYIIRGVRQSELGLLPGIERAAAAVFRGSIYPQMADAPLSSEHVDPADRIWVACDATDTPVGFAIARALTSSIHVHEIDVHPSHARRGLGAGLIEAMAEWAEAQGSERLTLSTFDDIPWNGPYYERLGFRALPDDELSPELQDIRRLEAAAGLPLEHRVCMARELGRRRKIPGAGNTSADTYS